MKVNILQTHSAVTHGFHRQKSVGDQMSEKGGFCLL